MVMVVHERQCTWPNERHYAHHATLVPINPSERIIFFDQSKSVVWGLALNPNLNPATVLSASLFTFHPFRIPVTPNVSWPLKFHGAGREFDSRV